jgi:hypothetical protein
MISTAEYSEESDYIKVKNFGALFLFKKLGKFLNGKG